MAGQLIRRGDERWLVRVFVGRDETGKKKYVSETVHGTKKLADAKLRDMLGRRDKGALRILPEGTVNAFLDEWLDTIQPTVRASTHDDYCIVLRRYVRPHIGTLPLKSITPRVVRDMLKTLRRSKDEGGHGLGPRTCRKGVEVLRNALEHAYEEELIADNPARGRLVKKALAKYEKAERQTVPAEKVTAFIKACESERLGALWLLLLFGGLRPSEALALRWDDVSGDTVRVQRVLVDRDKMPLQYAPPKSKESRRPVVLPQVVVAALRRHRKQQAAEQLAAGDAWNGQDLIFCNEIGQPLRQDWTRGSFRRVVKAAKLPALRIYDLRHSAASLLLDAGEDLKVISERLGHSTILLTSDTYLHTSRGVQQRAAQKLDALVKLRKRMG